MLEDKKVGIRVRVSWSDSDATFVGDVFLYDSEFYKICNYYQTGTV